MNFLKVGKIAAGVVCLTVAAGYGVLASIDVDAYRGDIIQAIEDATGRKVKISSPIRLKMALSPAAVIEGVDMSNAPWSKVPQMVHIGKAEAEIDLLSALFGTIQVNRLVLHDAMITMERNARGQGNWELSKPGSGDEVKDAKVKKSEVDEKSSDKADDDLSIAIRDVDIRNLKLAFTDAVSGQNLSINVKALRASAKSVSDPLKLTLDMAYDDLPIAAKGSLGPIQNLTSNKDTSVDLEIEVPGVKVKAKGHVGKPMTGQGVKLQVHFAGASYDQIGRAVGADLSGVPAVSFDGGVETFGKAGYRVVDGVVGLGDQKINLKASADLQNAVKVIRASLTADVLDLPKVLASLNTEAPASDQKASSKQVASSVGKADGRVFPGDALPVAGMHGVDVQASLAVHELTVPSHVKLSDVNVTASLKNGHLKVAPKFTVGGGAVTGNIALLAPKNAGASALSVKLKGANVSLGTLAKEMGFSSMVAGGVSSLSVDLQGRGASIRQIMAGLDGKVSVDTNKAEVINAELSKALGSWAMSGLTMVDPTFAAREKTMLSCFVVRVPVKNGMATINDSIAAETDVLNLVVDGDVNLKTEALDLGFDTAPHGVGTGIAKTATGLVRMQGTLANPSVGLDVLGTGKAAVKVGAAIATGGLSLLGDALLNEATKDSAPCATARGEASAKAQSSGQKTRSPATKKTLDPAAAVGGMMKGLFGK